MMLKERRKTIKRIKMKLRNKIIREKLADGLTGKSDRSPLASDEETQNNASGPEL